ncbi:MULTISPECIES: hypothetical protein [unclassified Streptomyces]|uniref:hypothetical protein n=1 Tax=unclassified Streptomyces TaxID=2593676 RepID=UPI001F1BFC6C|nr:MULTISPECIES: hypothetical protein [unclassified Streptomyces]MCF0087176.1 hypothetical protein [Streptomyces sp. MH192]MCF0098986.1 hypothetical protein [Streptomyces sp. MH191]
MRSALSRAWRHLGWRGLALAGTGACWTVYGTGLIVATRAGVTAATTPVTNLMCMEAWGGVWIACGVLGLAAGGARPGRDIWGFAAITLPIAVWALAYIAAAITGDYQRAWASVPLFAAVILLLVIVAAITGRRRRICTCERGASGGQ